jgi:hypothetical protein
MFTLLSPSFSKFLSTSLSALHQADPYLLLWSRFSSFHNSIVKAVRHNCPSNFKRKEKKEQGLEGKEKQGQKP